MLFANKTEDYINGKVELVIVWIICKIWSLVNYREQIQHHNCVIYCSVCSCSAAYIKCDYQKFRNKTEKT